MKSLQISTRICEMLPKTNSLFLYSHNAEQAVIMWGKTDNLQGTL